jgi:type II secretion system protein G
MKNKSIRKSRFTLIELLVVVGIIGILIGILLPAIASAMKEGKKTKAESDCKQIAMAIAGYKNDYGTLPTSDSGSFTFTGDIQTILSGGNPRAKVYFATKTGVTLTNPWGQNYTVQLDSDYDGVVSTTVGVVADSVAVWTDVQGGGYAKSWE